MEAVLLDLDLAEDVRRAGVVGWAVVGVLIARNLDRAGDVIQFGDIGELLHVAVLADMLNQREGVGRSAEAFGGHLDPPGLALLGFKFEGVHIGGGEEAAGDLAGEGDLLRLGDVVVGFGLLGGLGFLGRPGNGADGPGRSHALEVAGLRGFGQGEAVEVIRSALKGEIVDFDDVSAVGGRLEVDDAAETLHHDVPAFVVGDDDHGFELGVNAAGGEVDHDALVLFRFERVVIDGARRGGGVADRVQLQGHGGFDLGVGLGSHDFRERADVEGAGAGEAQVGHHAGFVNADRDILGDRDRELVGDGFACLVEQRLGGDAGMREMEFAGAFDVLAGDGDLDGGSGLRAHGEGGQQARGRETDGLGGGGGGAERHGKWQMADGQSQMPENGTWILHSCRFVSLSG